MFHYGSLLFLIHTKGACCHRSKVLEQVQLPRPGNGSRRFAPSKRDPSVFLGSTERSWQDLYTSVFRNQCAHQCAARMHENNCIIYTQWKETKRVFQGNKTRCGHGTEFWAINRKRNGTRVRLGEITVRNELLFTLRQWRFSLMEKFSENVSLKNSYLY